MGRKVERFDLAVPTNGIKLPTYPEAVRHCVTGFTRERGPSGRMLTLAVATCERNGMSSHRVTDYVTMMRLADLMSDSHPFPVNEDRLYGQLGRLCEIGRK